MSLRHHTRIHPDDAMMTDGADGSEVVMTTVDEVVASPRNTPTTTRRVATYDEIPQMDTYESGASLTLIIGGFLAFLLSAWAAIVPFVGPTFGFSADGTSSWTWNELHALTSLLPGAVGVVAAMMILVEARRPVGQQSATALAGAGFVLLLCGAWLAVAPVAWPVMVGSYFQAASPSLTLAYWMAYASGPGVLIASYAGFAMGHSGCELMARRVTAM